jgi:hypothetical protein
MEPYIKAICLTLVEDICDRLKLLILKQNKHIKIDEFKNKVSQLLQSMRSDKSAGRLILNKVYLKCQLPGIIGAETFITKFLNLLVPTVIADKPIREKLEYGYQMITDLFIHITNNIINLYPSSVMEGKDRKIIEEHINNDVKAYFDKLMKDYGVAPNAIQPIIGGSTTKDYKQKYKTLKEEHNELKSKYDRLKSKQAETELNQYS